MCVSFSCIQLISLFVKENASFICCYHHCCSHQIIVESLDQQMMKNTQRLLFWDFNTCLVKQLSNRTMGCIPDCKCFISNTLCSIKCSKREKPWKSGSCWAHTPWSSIFKNHGWAGSRAYRNISTSLWWHDWCSVSCLLRSNLSCKVPISVPSCSSHIGLHAPGVCVCALLRNSWSLGFCSEYHITTHLYPRTYSHLAYNLASKHQCEVKCALWHLLACQHLNCAMATPLS